VLGWGEGWGERIVREFGEVMYTLLYLKWITNKDLQYSTDNPAQCHVLAWMEGVCGAEWIRAAESLRCSPETITALL